MARTQSIQIREVLNTLVPPSRLGRLARETGAVVRHRRIGAVPFFWALVLGFSADRTRTLAGLHRAFESATGPHHGAIGVLRPLQRRSRALARGRALGGNHEGAHRLRTERWAAVLATYAGEILRLLLAPADNPHPTRLGAIMLRESVDLRQLLLQRISGTPHAA